MFQLNSTFLDKIAQCIAGKREPALAAGTKFMAACSSCQAYCGGACSVSCSGVCRDGCRSSGMR